MSYPNSRFAFTAPLSRSFAITALLGATLLASPLTMARADNSAMQSQAAADAADTKGETVEQRITSLHSELKITSDEEASWNNVAQSMRENEAAMQKLAAERTTVAPQGMSAVDDLNAYEKFAQAHVDGLKNLISSFKVLYVSMPDPQKKLADEVFQTFGHKGTAAHG
ncbi:MAG TPA: Spy/CpxP family protein refolding chaperone [Stellaceae bacterium]|nr:Spy/CpxP family protein refolding chaperone [Stellaceae bacterium]